jgi:hypothetical protein
LKEAGTLFPQMQEQKQYYVSACCKASAEICLMFPLTNLNDACYFSTSFGLFTPLLPHILPIVLAKATPAMEEPALS